MEDLISRQAAIDALDGEIEITGRANAEAVKGYVKLVKDRIERLPSAQPDDEETNYWHEKANSYEQTLAKLTQNIAEQPEIIRCKDCKHWTQSTGKMKGYGLGRCDFHDADLVTCNGFCFWAERRNDE